MNCCEIAYQAKTWRNQAAPIIADVISRVGCRDMRALRKALREAYPWGLRNYPYKIWLSEINRQLKIPARNNRRTPQQPQLAFG